MNGETVSMFGVLVPLILLAVIAFLYRERRTKVLRASGVHVFKPIWTIRMLYRTMLLFGGALVAGPSLYLGVVIEPFSTVAGLVIIGLVVYTWPPSLYVGWSKLSSRRWWGGTVEISWENVTAIEYDYHSLKTVVRGNDGCCIEHTLIDTDPGEFQREVVARAEHHLAMV